MPVDRKPVFFYRLVIEIWKEKERAERAERFNGVSRRAAGSYFSTSADNPAARFRLTERPARRLVAEV